MAELALLSIGLGLVSGRGQDFRQLGRTTGMVQDRVMLRQSPSAPEVPFSGARVWLLRAADGHLAWCGVSDAGGWYRAVGLELGERYVVLGQDLTGMHKATAAGAVVAVPEGTPEGMP